MVCGECWKAAGSPGYFKAVLRCRSGQDGAADAPATGLPAAHPISSSSATTTTTDTAEPGPEEEKFV